MSGLNLNVKIILKILRKILLAEFFRKIIKMFSFLMKNLFYNFFNRVIYILTTNLRHQRRFRGVYFQRNRQNYSSVAARHVASF